MDTLNNEQSVIKVAELIDLKESNSSQTEATQHADKGYCDGKLAEKLKVADSACSSGRDLLKADKLIGRVHPTDAVDKRLRTIQQQQQIQYTKNKELHQQQREQLEQIKETMEAMKKKEEQQLQIKEMLKSQKNQLTLLKQWPETEVHTQQQKSEVETRIGRSNEDEKNEKSKHDIHKIGYVIGTTDIDGD
ncbi:serum response factor homolog A-like [Rhopalosiphum maidis]|uniref:serum response factor homolog A-like n=1 Tax=Rhopalosiphum maidis TaxID=43146 RepID=UPI000F0088F3|nr:serum response factor homolog A-like [Rhopalosiphum maidis]